MKLVLTLLIVSLYAVWLASDGPETKLGTNSDILNLVRVEREASKGKEKEKIKVLKAGTKTKKAKKSVSKNNKKKNKPNNNKEKIIKQFSAAHQKNVKKTKPKKSNVSKTPRQDDICPDGVTIECMQNAQDVLKMEGNLEYNFKRQYKRWINQNNTMGGKSLKKFDFAHPAKHMRDAIGGNVTKMTCNNTNTGDNHTFFAQEFKNIYNHLINCSTFVADHCGLPEVNQTDWEAMTRCYNVMENTKTKTEKCRLMKTDGPGQCACWSDLKTNYVDVVKSIRPRCSTMKKRADVMKELKNACVANFITCKRAQDYSNLLIHHCQHFGTGDTWNPVMNETEMVEKEEAKSVGEGK